MQDNRAVPINLKNEVDCLFDDSSIPLNRAPTAAILMGGVATGKTTLRLRDYSRGYVLIDAAEIFHRLSRGDAMLNFPDDLLEPLEHVGSRVAQRAIAEGRNIVTEIVGADFDPVNELLQALEATGYRVEVVALTCELEEAIRRNECRGDNVSAYFAEPFQRAWIVAACGHVALARSGSKS